MFTSLEQYSQRSIPPQHKTIMDNSRLLVERLKLVISMVNERFSLTIFVCVSSQLSARTQAAIESALAKKGVNRLV